MRWRYTRSTLLYLIALSLTAVSPARACLTMPSELVREHAELVAEARFGRNTRGRCCMTSPPRAILSPNRVPEPIISQALSRDPLGGTLSDPAVDLKTNVKTIADSTAVRLYTLDSFALASAAGSILAGAYCMWRNWRALGDPEASRSARCRPRGAEAQPRQRWRESWS